MITPQNILEQCFIEDEVKDKRIVISSTNNSKRKDWPEAFQEMAKNGDDELITPDVFEDKELLDNPYF